MYCLFAFNYYFQLTAESHLGKIHSTNLRSTNNTRKSTAPYHASRRSMRRSASSSSLGSMAKDSDRHGIDDEQSNERSSDQSSALAESILKSTAVSKVKCFLRLLEKFLFQLVCSTSLCDPMRYKTKTNSSLVTRVFPRLMLVVRFYFEFSLVDDNVNFFSDR